MAAPTAFCAVFCTPSARPAQGRPACSATAVKASPLVLTVITPATSSTAVATPDPLRVPSARASMTAPMPTVSIRSGRSRLPARSDQYPTASRTAAPPTPTAANIAPAAGASQPLSSTRYTSPKVATANCGTTSSALVAWMRQSSGDR